MLLAQLLELEAGAAELQGQSPAEVGILSQPRLLEQPLLYGSWRGQVRTACVPLHLLEGAQGMGQQAQMVALERRQQGALELVDLCGAQWAGGVQARGVSRNPQEWPDSSRQCTRSTVQSGKVWRISCSSWSQTQGNCSAMRITEQ